ncbi:MAG: hypothetical protein IPJ31_15135 [Bacteroidetes bacterium]|nr:hypothetical protein [Bacteroidota bacterium]
MECWCRLVYLSKNKDIEIVGKIKESGKKISKEFPGTDGITHYYENEINYSQKFKAKANTVFREACGINPAIMGNV